MVVSACVDPISFEIPSADLQLVVEGIITNDPGPYTVKVSKGIPLEADSIVRVPVTNVKITLVSEDGAREIFTETEPGIYNTGGMIQGEVGKSYHIRMETPDGKIFESEPERINPVGEIENIRFEFEPRSILQPFGTIRADVFNIYVDANAGSDLNSYTRWRYTGTYKVVTYPELHFTHTPPYTPYKNPFPCSGYILIGGPPGSGGLLLKVGECTCCTCWVNEFEDLPQLSDTQLISNGEFRNVKVGEVPINNATFHEKFGVEVEQMSMSRKAFDFFKLIREQKEGASSIFQPPSGEVIGNIKSVNTSERVVGIFWASSITKKNIFIYPEDVPYLLTPIDFITRPCDEFYDNASNAKPDWW